MQPDHFTHSKCKCLSRNLLKIRYSFFFIAFAWVLAEFEENYFSEHQALIFKMHTQHFFSTSAIKRGREEEERFFFTRICIESQLCAIRFCNWRAILPRIKSKMEKQRDSRTSIFEIRREKKWRRGKKGPQKPQPATNRITYRRGISATRSGKWRIIKLVTMTTRWSRKCMTTWVAGQPN